MDIVLLDEILADIEDLLAMYLAQQEEWDRRENEKKDHLQESNLS